MKFKRPRFYDFLQERRRGTEKMLEEARSRDVEALCPLREYITGFKPYRDYILSKRTSFRHPQSATNPYQSHSLPIAETELQPTRLGDLMEEIDESD